MKLDTRKAALALSIGCAIWAPAHAADSATLYGLIDLGVEHLSFDHSSATRLGSGVQSVSRLGLQGQEDLGGGMSAFFQMETGFCANGTDSGSGIYTGASQGGEKTATGYCSGGSFMGRRSVVGLRGSLGTLTLGKQSTPFFGAALAADPFGTGLNGSLNNVDRGASIYTRTSQTVNVTSPVWDGVQLSAAYFFGGQPGSTANGAGGNIGITYTAGALQAGATYLTQNYSGDSSTTSLGLDATGRALTAGSSGYFKNKLWNAYAKYDFGPASVVGYYADEKYGEGAAVTGSAPELRVWMVGTTVPLGAGTVLASVVGRDDPNLAGSSVRQYGVGYQYALSRQTDLYTSYAHIANGASVDQYVGDSTAGGQGLVGGASSSGFAMGIRHQF